MKSFRSTVATSRLLLLAAVAALAIMLVLFTGVQTASAQTCMEDRAGGPLNCTANDATDSQFVVLSGPTECFVGDTITVTLQAQITGNAKTRYDIGFYVALDGGDARVGSCYQGYLPPPLAASGVYSPTSGVGPFWDAEPGLTPPDTCGDLEQNVATFVDLPELPIECRDEDSNGFLDIGTCASWDNQSGHLCEDADDTLPNNKAKCACGSVQIGIVVKPKLIVKKITDPPTTGAVFNFNVANPDQNNIDEDFDLAHGESWVSSVDLFPIDDGDFIEVFERLPLPHSSWSLNLPIICEDQVGNDVIESNIPEIPPGTAGGAGFHIFNGDIITCTFTNENSTLVELISFDAEAGAEGVTLAWETGAEIDNAGFNLYRSESVDGERVQINGQLIAATGDIAGASYSYTDADAGDGLHFYWLEDVDTAGKSTLHGPVEVQVGDSAFQFDLRLFLPFITGR